jgi:hypothetical protein
VDTHGGQLRIASSSGLTLTRPPVTSPLSNALPGAERRSVVAPHTWLSQSTSAKSKHEPVSVLKSQASSVPDSPLAAFNGSSPLTSFAGSAAMAAQLLGPYATAGFQMGNPNDVISMMPYFYPGLAAGFYPGSGIPTMPFMQPSLMPGPDSMFMYDPDNFGTPLTLLQIPARSIQHIQEKLSDSECTLTYYSQDCRHFSDLQKVVSSDNWTVARRAFVDVGYICRRCHIVYPGRNSCAVHQETLCYRDAASSGRSTSVPANAIVKLEQMQYECLACRNSPRFSTAAEYKAHCANESHRTATVAWLHAQAQVRPATSASEATVSAAGVSAADDARNALPIASESSGK